MPHEDCAICGHCVEPCCVTVAALCDRTDLHATPQKAEASRELCSDCGWEGRTDCAQPPGQKCWEGGSPEREQT